MKTHGWFIVGTILVLSGSARGQGVTFRVMNADSGQAMSNVSVQSHSFHMRPFFPYILPMCSYGVVCDGPTSLTDSLGIVRLDYDCGDRISFVAEGYVPVQVNKTWFGLKISEEPYERSSDLKPVGSIIVVPMRHGKAAAVWAAEAAVRATEDQAIKAIERLGGHVLTDEKAPDRPVISVDFSDTKVTEEDLKKLIIFPELCCVCLDGNRVTAGMLKALSPLKHLRSLSLSRTTLTKDEVRQLAELVQIQRLFFIEANITDAGLKELAPLKQIDFLDLTRASVGDADMKALAVFKNLSSLTLSFTHVADAGLQELAPLQELGYLELSAAV